MKKMLICACVTMAFLSGCMEVKTELFVRKNGSGTVTETVYMGPMLETMMQSMTQQFSAQMGSDSKGEEIQVPEETPIDEEKYKKKAGNMGEGVVFVSAKKVSKPDGSKGEEVIYSFDDIRALKLNADPESPGADSPAEGSGNKNPLLFEFREGDVTELIINMPRGEPKETDEAQAVPHDPSLQENVQSPDDTAAQFEQAKQMFQGFRVTMEVKVDGEITSTNAMHVSRTEGDVDDLITLFDMDIGKFLSTAEDPQKLKEMVKIKDMATAMEKFKGIPGFKIEPAEKVIIEFKGRKTEESKVALQPETLQEENVLLDIKDETQILEDDNKPVEIHEGPAVIILKNGGMPEGTVVPIKEESIELEASPMVKINTKREQIKRFEQ